MRSYSFTDELGSLIRVRRQFERGAKRNARD